MVNFGYKSAAIFWVLSLIILILNYLNMTSWTFLSFWGLTTVVEKSYKMQANAVYSMRFI